MAGAGTGGRGRKGESKEGKEGETRTPRVMCGSSLGDIEAKALVPRRMAEFTLESLHRYTPNEGGVEQWTVRGAKGLDMTFDPKCSVESGCDCLQVIYTPTSKHLNLNTYNP
jgi:hypothetical protein